MGSPVLGEPVEGFTFFERFCELCVERGLNPQAEWDRPAVRTWADGTSEEDEIALLWRQPFARDLDAHWNGLYSCKEMSEADFGAFMTWIYQAGWEVSSTGSRWSAVHAVPAGLPARTWTPPTIRIVPRFCVRCPAGAPAGGCAYVHGNTIHRLDPAAIDEATGKPNGVCKFGDGCKGDKRAGCLRMHPGETWTPDMVVYRN
jgi:hypothetical protein